MLDKTRMLQFSPLACPRRHTAHARTISALKHELCRHADAAAMKNASGPMSRCTPAVATHDTPLVAMLDGFTGDIEEPLGLMVAILIYMEVQVQVPLLGQLEHPAQLTGTSKVSAQTRTSEAACLLK